MLIAKLNEGTINLNASTICMHFVCFVENIELFGLDKIISESIHLP